MLLIPVKAQQPRLVLPIGHTGTVVNACYSPDGKLILTSADDNTAKIWDAKTGGLLTDLVENANGIRIALFSPDGKKIVTIGDTAKIWDTQTGNLLGYLTADTIKVRSASFSPDGKKIIILSYKNAARIYNALNGEFLVDLKGPPIYNAGFSPDGKKILTSSENYIAKILNSQNGAFITDLKGHTAAILSADFSPDGKRIVTSSYDQKAKVWDAETGNLLADLVGHTDGHIDPINDAFFSPDSKKILTAYRENNAKIWDAQTGALLASLKGNTDKTRSHLTRAQFSPDGKKIVTASDSTVEIWNAQTGALLVNLKGHSGILKSASFSPDNKWLITASDDHTAKIWDVASGSIFADLKGHTNYVNSACFSPDGKNIITILTGGKSKIWDAQTGTYLAEIKRNDMSRYDAWSSPGGKNIVTIYFNPRHDTVKIWDGLSSSTPVELKEHNAYDMPYRPYYSPDGKKLVTASYKKAKIWNAGTGKLLTELKGHTNSLESACYSPDGKKIVTASTDGTAKIWDAIKGTLLVDLKGHRSSVNFAGFSPDGKKIVTASNDKTAKVWDTMNGAILADLKGHTNYVINSACFSPDNKKIVTASNDNTAKIWDAVSGNLLIDLRGHINKVMSACFSPDGKKIVTASYDNTTKIWDTEKGTLLYTFFAIDSSDYIVEDKDSHYDGTPNARKLLYYVCGTEVIELQQLKDKLWIPGLVERINNSETINAPKLSDLDICGLIPVIEQMKSKTNYQFKITPRKGGLGETILFVNGIETKKYNPSDLKKVEDGYELLAEKNELRQYFVSGKKNAVTVKSYTKENDISSRGVTVLEDTAAKITTPPELYAVIIGVSDYKDDALDLKYAAKDAGDFSNAVSLSAKKLLGRDHVFMYDLTTAREHYKVPEKKSIRDVFTAIGSRATANDILLIFFAGHELVMGDKRQFYFLTADASPSSVSSTGVSDVGISAAELMDWMKPANIKAQKRILVLDACQSGSAINQIVNIGNDQGYLAARNDDKAEEIKQIDRLNAKSGLYILAASASDQAAYEMGRYSQGLLTYALLKVIKEHPEVLEQGKFLNVSGWFNEAEKIVNAIVRENNLRQQPQLITTTNFNIGIVDGEVLSNIILPGEKPLFASSNFQNNDEAIAYDDLDLSNAINRELNVVSSRGPDATIVYITATESPEGYIISGRYEVKADEIAVKVNIRKRKDGLPKYSFQVNGKKKDVKDLAANIVQKTMEWIGKNK